ncbi:uncharacterized protein V6R79_010661 [Siganus canaliculatus]
MVRRQTMKRVVQFLLALVLLVALIMLLMWNNNNVPVKDEWRRVLSLDFGLSGQVPEVAQKQTSVRSCTTRTCPDDQFSFFIRSGAANAVAPKICVDNSVVLGSVLNNAGVGINIVVMNGKTGGILKVDSFDMYGGDVNSLIAFLKAIEEGSVVLMASYDEPSSKLNEEAKKLIADLGSSNVQSLGFRDNWVFVGGKGASVKSSFEKHLKNDGKNNKYENWPELIELQGCIPRYVEA